MTGILGTLIDADSNVITFGRAVFAVLALAIIPPLLSRLGNGPKPKKTRDQRADQSADKWVLPSASLAWRYATSGALLAVHWVTFFVSVKTGGVAIATLGFSSFAAFITLIEWMIIRALGGSGIAISRSDWIRTIVVTLGLALITPTLALADEVTYGFIMGLISGLSFAAMAVFNSRLLANVNPIRVARNQNVVVALVMAAFALPMLPTVSVTSWLWLVVLGVFCTGLSHALFVSSLKKLRVNVAGLVIALEPVYAIVAAWLLFAEVPTARTIIGGLIIIGAIMGVSYSKGQDTNKTTAKATKQG
ncbi:MAG: EamA family transporter [Burkholderiaceae bacterium]|nr:EamA family transporter [Burkholderiaceae bacterium]MCD8536236.1 EamA family transporter [Burkholderiaceae bacterium]MCD8565972.1 EamA family transporter [Burkholderiaceae bacterium]